MTSSSMNNSACFSRPGGAAAKPATSAIIANTSSGSASSGEP
jgi:hypothetical protein